MQGADRLRSPEGAAVVAAVDCGTNSTRLLVAAVRAGGAGDGELETLDRRMRITRLGEGVDATGELAPQAIARTVAVLEEYGDAIATGGAERVRAAATSAVRDASNGAAFLDAAERVLGVRPEVLAGVEEGRLTYSGAVAGIDPALAPLLMVDIGGGSTELVLGRLEGHADPAAVVSVDIGCVRLTERYLLHDPPLPEELEAARAEARRRIGEARSSHPTLRTSAHLVGVAGTITTMAAMDQDLAAYDRSRTHHYRLSRSSVERLLAELAATPLEARRHRAGLEPARAEVIVAGALVLAEVMDCFDVKELIVSEDDILDGLAASLAAGAR